MNTPTAIIVVIGFATSLLCDAGESPGPALDRAAREAIIAAANQTIQKQMTVEQKKRKGNEIAKPFWGEAIAHLKPIRVLNDRVNVFIVLKEDETIEEGLYVSIPISSYGPGADRRFVALENLTQPDDKAFGQLYRCKLRKTQAGDGAIDQDQAKKVPEISTERKGIKPGPTRAAQAQPAPEHAPRPVVYFSGEFTRTGRFAWTNGMTLKDGIDVVGGLTQSANGRLRLLHFDGSQELYRLGPGRTLTNNPALQPEDAVISGGHLPPLF